MFDNCKVPSSVASSEFNNLMGMKNRFEKSGKSFDSASDSFNNNGYQSHHLPISATLSAPPGWNSQNFGTIRFDSMCRVPNSIRIKMF